MDLSIIIVSWNGEDVIKKCLASIESRFYGFDYEVIVIDNASKDKTASIIRSNFPKVRLKQNENNLGFAAANNQGIEMAGGGFILLLNQDVELAGDCLEKMHSFLKENLKDKIGVVAPRLVYLDGRPQASLRVFPTPFNVIIDALTLGKWHTKRYDFAKDQQVEQPMASCLMVEAGILKKIGGFDTNPNFFLYFNDVDLSYRINKLGYKHYYLADCKAKHHHGQGAKKWPEIKRIKIWCAGLYYFLAKHYSRKSNLLKFLIGLEVFFVFLGRILIEVVSVLLTKLLAGRLKINN